MIVKERSINYIKENHVVIILIAIFFLGVFLRFKGLTFQSYWLDELYSADFADPGKSIEAMFQQLQYDAHPPLYIIILRILYHIFGYNELTGRAFSAVIGCFAVPAIYFFGKELFNKYVGLYVSLIASTNYFFIFYSQETRSYTLLCLFSVFSMIFFSKVLTEQTKKNILLYWGSTAIMIYTHYTGIFLVAGQAFFILFHLCVNPEKRKELIRIAAATSVVLIAVLLSLTDNILMNLGKETSWIEQPSPLFFVFYIFSYVKSKYLFGLFALSGFFAVYSLFDRKSPNTRKVNSSIILLLICIVTAYLLPYLKGVLSAPMLGSSRYTIIAVPPILLLISYGIWRLGSDWIRIPVLLIITFFSIYALRDYYEQPLKAQYREVIRGIEKYNRIPVYSAVPYGADTYKANHYQVYANLLKIKIKIKNYKKFRHDLKNKTLPNCFWLLDAQKDHVTNSEINFSYFQSYKIGYKNAAGMLFSSYENPRICSEKIGLQLN